ncbi:adenylate kinase 9 [Echinops telfairi]|uniref:Adenylate kinase 9 n=1 Tax=Echinops telfairi TaxID=9371 RepID=A0AC55DFL8_ECHTE|nr:adenylate kinase 9 [Echinops telfairi]
MAPSDRRPRSEAQSAAQGAGKTTLAHHIAQTWKCIRIEAALILEEHISAKTPTGAMLQAILLSGQSVPDELIIKLMLEKLNTPQVAHFGYIITEMPSFSQEAISTLDQMELIKNLNLKPDILINIKCPNYDLCQRISGQRQHSTTGYLYPRDQWDPELIGSRKKKKKEPQKEGKGGEEEEEEEEQEEEEAFIAEVQLMAEVLQHLVQRPEDFLENVEGIIQLYKDTILHLTEGMMAEHNSQYLIELDGKKSSEELFLTVIERLQYLNLKRAAVITKLQSAEEEMSDVMENDELFRNLASFKLIAPRYRWQRSRWGRACPVVLKEGDVYPGLPDYSVSFLGKIYCLSSEEALKAFSANPRPYLLPPMPAPPCKVFIFGPKSSGKTTLSNLIAEKYKGKVVDYVKLVQPRFDQALETLIANTIAEATALAIRLVKEKLLKELQDKKRESQASRELERNEKMYEELQMREFKGPEEFPSSIEEDDNPDPPRESSLEEGEEAKTTTDKPLDDQKDKSEKDAAIEDTIEEVTAEHPEVVAMIEEAVKKTKDMNFDQPYEKHAEILEAIFAQISEENKNRYPGAPRRGGWIVENCPVTKKLWTSLADKGILPDLIICLSDTVNNGKYLLSRLYLENKPEVDAKILERLREELQKKKREEEAVRKAAEEALKIEEENQRMLEAMKATAKEEADQEAEEEIDTEESEVPEGSEAPEVSEDARQSLLTEESELSELPETESDPAAEPTEIPYVETEIPKESKEGLETEKLSETEVMLPEYPKDSYPDVPEMEPFKESLKHFAGIWKQLETTLGELIPIPTLSMEIAGKTPEELLQQVIEMLEKPFKYIGWELTVDDYDEEAEDYQAEIEADEDFEEEEEEEEENEDRIKERRRQLGDSKHYCPVVLKENFILQPGNVDEAVKYREKIYYFSSPETKEKFLEHPEEYIAHKEPLKAPPLRLCLLGPHGSGKTVCGSSLAKKLGIFHIQFEEFLQEKLMLKTEKKVGPEFEEDSEDEQMIKQEIEELAIQANIVLEEEKTKKPPPEVHLTEEEDAIKSNLIENEPLPPEILEGILSEWWFKEPICSTGFILDGFPRYLEEAQFLGERGFFPDAAVFLQVDDQDVTDRLLPTHLEKWKQKQKKKLDRKKLIKDMKTKIRDDMITKRRAELLSERERKRRGEASAKEDEDMSEDELDDEEDSIENILDEEFPKDEEEMSEEDEEQESEAVERLKSELGDKFETDLSNLQVIQEEFDKFLIPIININGARKTHIVQYILDSKVKPMVENRASIFEKCFSIAPQLAQKMLNYTYRYTSSFGYWDPVKLSEGETLKPIVSPENPIYPVIHRQYIYFLSSKETKEKFMKNPIKYIRQPKPKPTLPLRIVIVGPPKSGKTTVAKKIQSEYCLRRLSIGDVLRFVINNQSRTELALMLNWHLYQGLTAPDELATQALEIFLMDSICNTAGVVIDGYPVTKKQVNALEARTVIPMIIFELDVPSREIFKRLILDKKEQQSFPYPLHNSAQITAVNNSKYRKVIDEIRHYYQEQHQNWYVIDGLHSKWWVWNEVIKKIQMVNSYIQTYLERIKLGSSANTRQQSKLLQEPLPNIRNTKKFLENPELYVPPLAPHPLPSASMIPKRLTLSELKSRFPKCAELQGYCPVTYQDGKQRYEALIPGNLDYALEYCDRIYICETEEKLQKFFRSPLKYWDQKLPNKLPPLKEPIFLTSLPLPGYLEQGVANSLIKAMNAVGCLKPKFPFLSIRRSALLFIALHLKAFNPKSSGYTRNKYKKKMDQFVERCELITYLGAKMTRNYKEPQYRAIDFDHKLQAFLALRNIDPVNG